MKTLIIHARETKLASVGDYFHPERDIAYWQNAKCWLR
jgi:hypothetical protein